MSSNDPAVVTCALTGVLTNPARFPVPVTPEEMADAAEQAWNAGATVLHCHYRNQEPGMGFMPSWEPDVVASIDAAIRDRVPQMIINMSTGVVGDDISGPVACLERIRPEVAAMNAGSLNYLKVKRDGTWAWPPLLFDNTVDKIERFLEVMDKLNVVPECECFDTGIVRSIAMLQQRGLLKAPVHVSFVMGVASGMPAKASWLPLLVDELNENVHWQTIAIGRDEVWEVHSKTAELGGHLRTGLEDTFYLPNGEKATSNGQLIEAIVAGAREVGREIATVDQARGILGVEGSRAA
ncbi:MAG TPA: 3-keto-5-aminohexanoate cleavage protein [Deltaproteobacteria bacterium]|nr:3-keto-5-aminohexanoate cleavage protein [Deltaproteobacteria bacterium]HCP48448.1 3-keto-5-aminohexanoate cleavage protein [Deltaproteobacteria bacterium]